MGAITASVGCAYIAARVPVKVVPWVKYVCGAVGIGWLVKTLLALPAWFASYYTYDCYQFGFTSGKNKWVPVSASKCVPLSCSWSTE